MSGTKAGNDSMQNIGDRRLTRQISVSQQTIAKQQQEPRQSQTKSAQAGNGQRP